ncbi:aaa family atpase like protein [Zymoseptoria brevis]|uniref:Aaa family atpase like protein n=1 Tax=Zymoseptoria brevis TaxID=1047168 RepID=A0A0F4GJQ0_9PEZI|nr:aaa family atpase like protein [Zymoseptoria brevis]
MVACPICNKPVKEADINCHIDSECKNFIDEPSPPATQGTQSQANGAKAKSALSKPAPGFFTPAPKRNVSFRLDEASSPAPALPSTQKPAVKPSLVLARDTVPVKRERAEDEEHAVPGHERLEQTGPVTKKVKNAHAPLAERMRPQTLDEVAGQDLVGANGVLRNLIVTDRVPSMILWGGPGTGKTTIARLIAQTAGTRFAEINSTSSGVAECKKLFSEAKNELGLTGRKTIIFCDEIHRFSKSQQDVFLGPVEAGQVTLIGATTENPSFKVANALLSRCRTFTLAKLTDDGIFDILKRALIREVPGLPTPSSSPSSEDQPEPAGDEDLPTSSTSYNLLTDDNYSLIRYLAAFADGDARTGLNLLELALDLCKRPRVTTDDIKQSLTQTLVYDRAGDQHYDTISAFHKSIRGSNADAALYYLARMLQSGEDPLFIARRMVVMASEDVGLADNTILSLATATYTAAERIGMPECRINLAHCAVALSSAPKSVRAYRGLNAAYAALKEPGIAGLPVPVHLRNAPTRLMKELGYGKEYKYNPDYADGRVVQDYLPEKLKGRSFLASKDLGDKIDPEVTELDEQSRFAEEFERGEELLLNPDGD